MKAYIILVHKNPQQVYRLIQKLDDGNAMFFVHIDKKISAAQFEALHPFKNKIKFVQRVKTNWGSYGLVTATLHALKEIKKSAQTFKQVILLSGQDYPVKSNSFIDEFFNQSGYSLFIEYFKIPNHYKWKPRGGLYRIDKYYLGDKHYEKLTAKAINFLSMVIPVLKRKLPGNLVPYAGSQWWIIDMHALNYIIDFVEANPGYVSFHRYTFAADEVFFHTILLNAKDEKLLNSIFNSSKTYVSWKDTSNPHPDVLIEKDFDDLLNTDALFARKFDAATDSKIFDLVDQYCLTASYNTHENFS